MQNYEKLPDRRLDTLMFIHHSQRQFYKKMYLKVLEKTVVLKLIHAFQQERVS